MGKKINKGMVQTIFKLLLIVAFGVLGGWFFSIETTLTLSLIGIIFIACWIWSERTNSSGGGGSDALGVFFMFMISLSIFTVVLLGTGLIVHWDDLLYILRGLFR